MPQELLDERVADPVFKGMAGEAVAEGMRRHPFRQAQLPGMAPDEQFNGIRGGASLTVLGNSHPLGRPYRYDLQVTVTEYGIPVLPVQASVKMKKAALDKLNNSKQDPLPIQADDKNWNADQNLMDWLNGFGILGSIPIHILQSETLE